MRIIDHHLAEDRSPGGDGRTGDVFDPNTSRVQATVALDAQAGLG